MKRAAAYCRMSTDRQEHSIDSQLRLIKDYAQRNDFYIVQVYKDEGISGRNAEKRPGFLQMIDDSAGNEFDAVLIYDSSRFARNLEQSIVYKSVLKRNNVQLLSITEPIVDDDSSLITDALMGAMNEMYSRKLSKNVKRGRDQKVLRGEYCGKPPFGYVKNPAARGILVNPEAAQIVKIIFQCFLQGQSMYSITIMLNDKGIKTQQGLPFRAKGVQEILGNPAYKGYFLTSIDGERTCYKTNQEAIISEEDFDKAQELLKEIHDRHVPKERPPETHIHWLSGRIRCAKCGSVCVWTKGYNGRKNRFKCCGVSAGRCKSPGSVPVDLLEKTIIERLQDLCVNSENLFQTVIVPPKIDSQRDFDFEINRLQVTLSRAKEAYLHGIDSIEEYKALKERLEKEIQGLHCEQSQEALPATINPKIMEELPQNLVVLASGEADMIQKQKIIRSIIGKVVLDATTKSMWIHYYG